MSSAKVKPIRENGVGADNRPIMKARFVGSEAIAQSNAIQNIDPEEDVFTKAGAIPSPYDARALTVLVEHSNSLRQNIDAYVTNIDGFGHRFEPVIDLDADEAEENVRTAMILETQLEQDVDDEEFDLEANTPSDKEVEERMETLRREQQIEKMRLEHFFEFCCDESSFIELRRQLREDLETNGNGFWEVQRNGKEEPSRFKYIPSFSIRLLPLENKFTPTQAIHRTVAGTFEKKIENRHYRKYIQQVGSRVVYYKQFGDPRVMSATSGRYYTDVDELKKEEEDRALEATELWHFEVHSARSAYGIPRWIGNLLAVLGNRQAEEVNFLYFENKSVPPLAVLVSGGRLTDESVTRLESYIENEIKGKRNFHKVLVLEAEGESSPMFENSGKMRVELKPLTDAQMGDALFQNYDERNIDKVGMAFRLPRLLRGDTRDFNRSTAQAALEFAESQVFAPIRGAFDFLINRKILPLLKCKHWKFASIGPTKADPEQLVKMVRDVQDILPPNTLADLLEPAFGRDFPNIEAPWAKQPLKLTLAGVPVPEGDGEFFVPPGTNQGVGETANPPGDVRTEPRQKPPASDAGKSAGALQPAQGKTLRRSPPAIRSKRKP